MKTLKILVEKVFVGIVDDVDLEGVDDEVVDVDVEGPGSDHWYGRPSCLHRHL